MYHFEIKLTKSSIDQVRLLTPAAIAGVIGYGIASVLAVSQRGACNYTLLSTYVFSFPILELEHTKRCNNI